MRSYDEYRQILELWGEGESKKGIARITGIPRATVRDCIKRYENMAGLDEYFSTRGLAKSEEPSELRQPIIEGDEDIQASYAYLLGMYLGDGCITKPPTHRVYLLRITLDKKYPGIIAACMQAIQTIFPNNKVNTVAQTGCFNVTCYHKHWPVFFPQHGEGLKHTRPIILEAWQERIAADYPLEIFRGLYHSDGSRSSNVVKGRDYPRYMFHNESPDIRRIFCDACDRLNVRWTVANRRNISIARRKDVARLDALVGPKS